MNILAIAAAVAAAMTASHATAAPFDCQKVTFEQVPAPAYMAAFTRTLTVAHYSPGFQTAIERNEDGYTATVNGRTWTFRHDTGLVVDGVHLVPFLGGAFWIWGPGATYHCVQQ